jgi:hypothetical protein
MPTTNDQGYFLQNSLEDSIRNGSFSPTGVTFANPKSTTNFEMKDINKIRDSLLKSNTKPSVSIDKNFSSNF